MGHENVGIVEAIGDGVKTDYVGKPIKEGDRLIFAPGTDYGGYGFQWNPDEAPHFRGGFADYMYLTYPNTCFMKTDASPEVAVLTEPFTVGVHAVMRGQIKLGDTVVVQGSGAIGLVTLACAKLSGAGKIIMVGGPSGRLELAKRFGADVTIDIEEVTTVEERTELMTAPKAKALGFFSSFSVLNFGRWASFAYCDMLLGFYRVFVWLFQLIENSPSDLINLSNVEVAPARGAATGFLLSPN